MFNVDADELIERLEWTYGPKTNATVFHLVARRRGDSTPSNYVSWFQRADTHDPLQLFDRAEILIDRRTHRTHALRLFHENTESLSIVEKDVVLGPESANFWQPDLTGFRLFDDACR